MNEADKIILRRSKLKLVEVYRALVLLSCPCDPEYLDLMDTIKQSVKTISFLQRDHCENNTNN